MQNTPDRHPARFSGPLSPQDFPGQHPCRISRVNIPAGFPGRMRHNKHVTATRPLQNCVAAAFRITPNAGCVPGTGAVRMLSGARQGAWDGTGSSAKEATKKRREEPREQRRSSRGSRKNNDRNSSGSRTGTMQDQPKQQKEQRQEQRRGKTGTAAEATAGRTEEGKLQRKIRSSTYNPEAAFAKNFNNKAAIKSQPNSQIR